MFHHLIEAVKNLEEALIGTPEEKEREAIKSATAAVRKILQRRGIFIGSPDEDELIDPAVKDRIKAAVAKRLNP